jgi:hypothetical protein
VQLKDNKKLDINNLKSTYGHIGFIPFAIFSIIPWVFGGTYAEISIKCQLLYGGAVLSFLSGMTWGWKDGQPHQKFNLSMGIVFSLIGIAIIFMVFFELTFFALIASITIFQLFYRFEKSSHDFKEKNDDYKKFRKMLSLLVSISFLISFAYWINPYSNPIT